MAKSPKSCKSQIGCQSLEFLSSWSICLNQPWALLTHFWLRVFFFALANGGWETFLSYEDPSQDILIGLLRLRKVSNVAWLKEITNVPSSMIRELHVYGTAVAVSARDPTRFQHQGFGILLMEEAERIAREEHGSEKLLVISGVGTRHYYRKLDYHLDGPYMSKMLV